jgi:hypothetical protein
MKVKNPYAAKDGSPKLGMTAKWSQWQTEAEKQRRDKLTPEQRQAEDEARRPLRDRMQAESDFR